MIFSNYLLLISSLLLIISIYFVFTDETFTLIDKIVWIELALFLSFGTMIYGFVDFQNSIF